MADSLLEGEGARRSNHRPAAGEVVHTAEVEAVHIQEYIHLAEGKGYMIGCPAEEDLEEVRIQLAAAWEVPAQEGEPTTNGAGSQPCLRRTCSSAYKSMIARRCTSLVHVPCLVAARTYTSESSG